MRKIIIPKWIEEHQGKYYCSCGCGQKIIIKPHHHNYGIPKYIQGHQNRGRNNPMYGKANAMRGKHYSESHNKKVSLRTTEAMKRPETREKCQKGALMSKIPSHRLANSIKHKELWKTKEYRENVMRGHWDFEDSAQRQRKTKLMLNLWQSPEYIRKQMRARGVKPNKSEAKLDNLLEKLLPNEYKFVGDGQFILAGRCPDFVNINGQKKIIELYGDYWHRNDNPQDRIDLFAGYGYQTLIIWEKELKKETLLKVKIIEFNRR